MRPWSLIMVMLIITIVAKAGHTPFPRGVIDLSSATVPPLSGLFRFSCLD